MDFWLHLLTGETTSHVLKTLSLNITKLYNFLISLVKYLEILYLKGKSTSKTQRLILIYTEVNIFFILTLGIHNFSLNNRQPSKLPPHWEHLSKLRSKDATATRTSKKKSFTTHNHNFGCTSHFFVNFFAVFSSWNFGWIRLQAYASIKLSNLPAGIFYCF